MKKEEIEKLEYLLEIEYPMIKNQDVMSNNLRILQRASFRKGFEKALEHFNQSQSNEVSDYNEVYDIVKQGEWNLRKVFKSKIYDAYYSGYLDSMQSRQSSNNG